MGFKGFKVQGLGFKVQGSKGSKGIVRRIEPLEPISLVTLHFHYVPPP